MIFVFGWTPRNADEGPVVETDCSACKEPTAWHLHTVTMWVSFFMVRVFPTGVEYWLRCSTCGDGFELGEQRNAVIRRGDSADDPTVIQWIEHHQRRRPPQG